MDHNLVTNIYQVDQHKPDMNMESKNGTNCFPIFYPPYNDNAK